MITHQPHLKIPPTPLALLILGALLLVAAGCTNALEVGVERTPMSRSSLEATVEAMAADNARLATQVAQLSAGAATAAASVATAAPAPATTTITTTTPAVVASGPSSTPASAAAATPSPTVTRASSTTPASATRAASATSSARSPSVQAEARIAVASANLRSGPGAAYGVVGQASAGRSLPVLRRNEPGDWVQVTWENGTAWLAVSVAELSVPVTDLPVVTAVPGPTSSPRPSPTAVPAPACDVVPIRGFGKVWSEHPEVAAQLGCPTGWPLPGEVGIDSSVQRFEHGVMLWLAEDTQQSQDPVYALFDNGEYQRFPDLGPADPVVVGTIDPGFEAPGPRFSKAYWEGTGARVRERLGRAVTAQVDGPGAYQQFVNGRMFWNAALDRIFVLLDYWVYDTPGKPGRRVMNWVGYEDTFVE